MMEGTVVNLTLSVCGKGQFTCADGSCIDLTQRCDLRINCLDQSDEAQCSLVDIPPGYRTVIPPPPITDNNPLPIFFQISIISFPTIATQDLTFTATFQLSLQWQDTRLNYLNLKEDRTLNLLSGKATSDIWTPRVFFSNAQGNMFTNLDQGARVELNVFPGEENSLEMSQLYTATYSCDFHLAMFPFDSQVSTREVCQLTFTLVSAASSYMVLDPDVATYTGPKYLIEYEIGEITITRGQTGEFSSIQVFASFYRRYTFYLLTLYIPTILLILIAYATFYFNPDDFNSRVVVAVTSLLVLTSLLTQTSNALPKTSYFKLIDVWLFFSIVIIFVVILLQTLVNFSKPTSSTDHSWLGRLVKRILSKKTKETPDITPVRPFSRLPGKHLQQRAIPKDKPTERTSHNVTEDVVELKEEPKARLSTQKFSRRPHSHQKDDHRSCGSRVDGKEGS
ncbi:Glycine receptor subunit alpha-4-like 3, partial [Homarus americanus]